ncbi:hypothetical protein FOZ60_012136 [Perkinsus olseni]|uniref:Uncharacterized protein n=1 Tax=Perkinsus olseni TaxID=32597 RepID=A0A7J6NC06_PEROL|nr:hypothetical protein FOZ60_012136 [Perkinsus olseni]
MGHPGPATVLGRAANVPLYLKACRRSSSSTSLPGIFSLLWIDALRKPSSSSAAANCGPAGSEVGDIQPSPIVKALEQVQDVSVLPIHPLSAKEREQGQT